jgi:integrase
MAKTINKLTDLKVRRKSSPGLYGDGNGLYLQVTSSSAKSWLFRYMLAGKARAMGLGSVATVSLAEARTAALAASKLRAAGKDPIASRAALLKESAAKALTFKEACRLYIETHKAKWRSKKHLDQWENSLKRFAEPVLGGMPIDAIDTASVLKVLTPLWKTQTESASRLRGRIESVIDWAKVKHGLPGENPARWRGHLKHVLPSRAQVQPVIHFPALPVGDIPAFMQKLRNNPSIGALALELDILTASRPGGTQGMRWLELDTKEKVWTLPPNRMKKFREQRVPLSNRALEIVEVMRARAMGSEFVFPGNRKGKPLSAMAMWTALRRLEPVATVHGFRSTFRDWAADNTSFQSEVVKAALAHKIKDKTDAAYLRGELFEKRRELMAAWERYCLGPMTADNVVRLTA